MKIPNNRADAFARQPDPLVRAVLAYGPDSGLVNERVGALVASVLDDPKDPFRLARLPADGLRKDPARLSDEVGALSLTGGRRVVVIEDAGDEVAPILAAVLEAPASDTLIVLKAGDLPQRSKLRKILEAAKDGAALACYRDEDAGLSRLINEQVKAAGLEISRDALAYLESHLGGDRQITRSEIGKLLLYKGDQDGPIDLADAEACVGDNSLVTLDDLAYAVGGGNLPAVEQSLSRSYQEGHNPVTIVRAVARHFQRLHLVVGLGEQGQPLESAMKRLRPPVFWKTSDPFKAQCRAWPGAKLTQALGDLTTAEISCKETGQPAELLVARTLWALAANAPRAARGGAR